LRPLVPYSFLGFLLLSASSFRGPAHLSRGRGFSWGVAPRSRRGEPRRFRHSVLLPARPPRGGWALASCSIADRISRNRSVSLASPGPPRLGSWTSQELAGGGSCRSVLTSPWGGAEDGVDGDEEGRGFSGQGTRQVVPLRVPRDRVLVDRRWTSAGLGVARHLVSPTDRPAGPRAPLDGSGLVRTQGPSPPRVGILSILVTPRDRPSWAGWGPSALREGDPGASCFAGSVSSGTVPGGVVLDRGS
jgi:hypothetical protein